MRIGFSGSKVLMSGDKLYRRLPIFMPFIYHPQPTIAMHGKKICFAVLIFIVTNGYSQRSQSNDVENIAKLSLLAPAISYEQRIGHLQTLHVQAFLNINFGVGYSSSQGNTSFLYVNPAAGVQYRYYYNAARRQYRGKRTEMNSMNYIAPVYTMAFSSWSISDDYYGEDKRRPVHNLGLVWGMQRNYAKRFSLDINAGPGIVFANTTLYDENFQPTGKKTAAAFQMMAQIRLGIWLNAR